MVLPAPTQAAEALPRKLARPEGSSPAAQALDAKKPSGFLRLFRRIAGAAGAANRTGRPAGGRKAPGEVAPATAALPAKALPSAGGPAEGGAVPFARAARPGRETAASQGHPAPQALSGRARKKTAAAEAEELSSEARIARRARGAAVPGRQAPEAALAAAPAGPAPARRPRGASPREGEVQAVEARREMKPAQARVFVLDLRSAEGENPGDARRASAVPERAEGSGFEKVLLARESGSSGAGARPAVPGSGSALPGPALQERLLPEIVHQAGIILRDGGEGEIRLVLKPEHLGSVRIRLHLGESSLEGRIVVDNSNVKELLESNLEGLKSALRQEGWATANIDVTVSGDGGRRRQLEPEAAPPAVAERSAGGFERAALAALDLGFTAVNLLA